METNAPKDIKDWQIHLFKNITGVDPENTKIKGIVVFNVKELMHVFRRIWQDFGPFPLIGIRDIRDSLTETFFKSIEPHKL